MVWIVRKVTWVSSTASPAIARFQAWENRLPMSDKLPTFTRTLCVAFNFCPFYIGQKIGHPFLRTDKAVGGFGSPQVLVVTFATFVVIAHDAFTVKAKKQAVLQPMWPFRR